MSNMKLLFICNQNKHRSRTAEDMFRKEFDTRSAGLYNANPVTEQQLSWADVVVVMDDDQRRELGKRFPSQYLKKRIVSLDVPDVYNYGDTELMQRLKTQLHKLL